MNFFGDNNYIWLIILICCCGCSCLTEILPLLLILECCCDKGNGCGNGCGGGCGCGNKFCK